MTLIQGRDCLLNVEVLGTGEPVTLFAHGITGSTDELMPLAAKTRGTRVLLDARGHGLSDSPAEELGYDHAAFRRDLEAAGDAFNATRVVGLSVGAGALLNLLADDPDRFDRIVLVSPASIDRPNVAAEGLFLEMARRLESQPLDEVAEWSLEGSRELIAREPKWEMLIRERVRRMNSTGVPRALRGYVHGRPPLSDTRLLRKVRSPVLILACEGDPIHDIAIARRLCDLLPNAELVTWQTPLGMFDDEQKTAGMIAEFLR
ncbi:MAG: alpha/beta fold hydrolase [Actinomycetota bacterium]